MLPFNMLINIITRHVLSLQSNSHWHTRIKMDNVSWHSSECHRKSNTLLGIVPCGIPSWKHKGCQDHKSKGKLGNKRIFSRLQQLQKKGSLATTNVLLIMTSLPTGQPSLMCFAGNFIFQVGQRRQSVENEYTAVGNEVGFGATFSRWRKKSLATGSILKATTTPSLVTYYRRSCRRELVLFF